MTGFLTYEPFYGLGEKPFSLSPDPRFLFKSPAHAPAFDDLLAGIRRREGLIVLTGEIGTGKTTLCRSVLQHLDRRTFAAFVADPFVSREDLLKKLLVDFGVVSSGDLARFSGASRSDLSYPLYEFLDSLVPLQAFAVVVIDEAQNLSVPLLEEIRILSELERREKLLQVVLVGQPELRAKLKLPEMRQVDQRVSAYCELSPLDAASISGYVTHRLDVASQGGSRVAFTPAALAAIYEGSSGVPRLINRICDRALQRAFSAGEMQIDIDVVRSAVAVLGLSTAVSPRTAVSPQKHAAPAKAPATMASPVIASPVIGSPAIAHAPAVAQAAIPSLEISKPGLTSYSQRAEKERTASGYRWMATAATAVLALSASIGASAWYSRSQTIDGSAVAAMAPMRPVPRVAQPAIMPAPQDALTLPELRPDEPGSVPLAVPSSGSTTVKPRGYSILVASFQHRSRAERLVDELVNAGYGARTVERDAGERGRFVQVEIRGYTSAIDVQRDLQRIRQLPGGYGDAKIIER